jgi:probable HAF family extracellular repeat protein
MDSRVVWKKTARFFFLNKEGKMKKWNLLAMVLILIALFCLANSGAASPEGKMTDLGTPTDWTRSYAYGINNKGQIVGYLAAVPLVTEYHYGFSYSRGTWLGYCLLGYDSSYARGINDSGQVVGYSVTAPGTEPHAFLYSGSVMKDLGSLGGGYSMAFAINNKGQVVGTSKTALGEVHAFLYSGGKMTDLGTTLGWPTGINNNGQVVGTYTTASGQSHAFLYNSASQSSQSLSGILHLLLGADNQQ